MLIRSQTPMSGVGWLAATPGAARSVRTPNRKRVASVARE
jgi:hypothetical protein